MGERGRCCKSEAFLASETSSERGVAAAGLVARLRRWVAHVATWPGSCSLLGRLVILGSLVYAFGGPLVRLARVGFRAVSGSRPEPYHISEPVRLALARGEAALPAAAVGLLLVFAGAVIRFVQRRRAARAAPESTGDASGAEPTPE